MPILDTSPISILERRNAETARLSAYLETFPDDSIYITVISYEEQIRGWMSALGSARNPSAQVLPYTKLLEQLENYCNLQILPFDDAAANRFQALRREHRRISSPDLKIAAIALVHNEILITQNTRDFENIVGLKLKDWTRE